MLHSIASTNDENGSKKLFENISDGDFKQRLLKNPTWVHSCTGRVTEGHLLTQLVTK
jgi:hypothetical protein